MAEVVQKLATELRDQVEMLRSFLHDHPEVGRALGIEAARVVPPVPLTMYHILHELVDMIPATDLERRDQMHDVLFEHEAAATGSRPGPAAPPAAEQPPGIVTAPEPAPAAAAAPAPVPPAPVPAPPGPAPVQTTVAELAEFMAWKAQRDAAASAPAAPASRPDAI